ncbi:group II truncated hemoglobin [Rheinheimera sp. 1928-s]|jgi:hemoglobin|uniref:group II truncated hemoglobin n=1 Tax=Rheinheimera sp. 1928-s TaxID=3033803 RepID=UPI0026360E5C|nr:group II truncated hemoglobin [Rheinheimera sp. 1928-s]MDF3125462.1 group II truncated hemoglobin [Rheinheimera sp. 1928-s]
MKKLFDAIFNKSQPNSKPHPTPATTPYELIGGEAATRRLANRFYDIMSTAPEAAELYAIHPLPLDVIRQKFFEFLSGWLGGPSLFEEKYGHPRLRMRHMPFAVDQQMRDQWMFCMDKALAEVVEDKLLRQGLSHSLAQLASHMINR